MIWGRELVVFVVLAVVAAAQQGAPRKATVAGKVLGVDGSRAQITMYYNDGRRGTVEPVAGGVADSHGAFELRDVPWFAGGDWRFHWVIFVARIDGQVGMTQIRRDVDTKALTIKLRPTRRLRGVLRDEASGKPIANAWVWPMIFGARGRDGPKVWPTAPMMPWHTRTDAKGRFVLKELPSYEDYVLDVGGPHHARRLLKIKEPRRQVQAKLAKAGRLTGCVRLANGKPAVGVVVWANGGEGFARCKTDEQGWYEFESLAEESYRVEASQWDGYGMMTAALHVEVTPGETVEDVDLQFEKGGFISGRLVDSATGKPIAASSITILAMGPEREFAMSRSSVRANSDGTFRLHAPAGSNRLSIESRGKWQSGRQSVVVVEGADVKLQWVLRQSKPRD